MPLYLVHRPFPGASKTDLEAAGFRALACAHFYSDMRWVRSFWDAPRGEMQCIYEAQSEEDIRRHAMQSGIPCGEVRLVDEIIPDHEPSLAPA